MATRCRPILGDAGSKLHGPNANVREPVIKRVVESVYKAYEDCKRAGENGWVKQTCCFCTMGTDEEGPIWTSRLNVHKPIFTTAFVVPAIEELDDSVSAKAVKSIVSLVRHHPERQ